MQTLAHQRRHWRRVTAAVAVFAAVTLAIPLASWAGGGPFTDVDTDHPFVNEIAEVSNAGVANGFNDGTYRPSQTVTRQAMAAFLSRAGSSIQTINSSTFTLTSSANTTVRNLLIDVPGSNDGATTQYVHVQGVIRIADNTPPDACDPTCILSARVRHATDSTNGPDTFFTLTTHVDDDVIYDTLIVDDVFEVDGGGEQFELQARYAFLDGGTFSLTGTATLTATVIPFSAQLLL